MSKKTFLQHCQEYQKKSGLVGSDIVSVLNQSGMLLRLTKWIRDADFYVQGLWADWDFLRTEISKTTSTDTSEYSLSTLGISDFGSWIKDEFILKPGQADFVKLTELPFSDWKNSAERHGVITSREPTEIVFRPSGAIVFVGRPNAAYDYSGAYYKTPTKLTANADTSNIPEMFEDIIYHKAKMYHADYYEDDAMYRAAENDFEDMLVRLEANQLPGQESRSKADNSAGDNVIEVV